MGVGKGPGKFLPYCYFKGSNQGAGRISQIENIMLKGIFKSENGPLPSFGNLKSVSITGPNLTDNGVYSCPLVKARGTYPRVS